jgi:hypothetical protein
LYLPDGTGYVRTRGEEMKSTWRIERDMVCEYSVVLKKDVCRTLYKAEGNEIWDVYRVAREAAA